MKYKRYERNKSYKWYEKYKWYTNIMKAEKVI